MGTDKMAKIRQQMEAGGWKMASATGGAHLKITLGLYQELGGEVYLKEVKPEECEGCTRCFTENKEVIYRIYTRPHST